MAKLVSRRRFLEASLKAGSGAAVLFPAAGIFAKATASPGGSQGICVTLCNHWSYTGIGWQLGIESDVLSVMDGMEIFDRPPHIKTCIEMDARA